MPRKTHHVVPDSDDGGWDIKKGGADRAASHFDRKQDAVNRAREISRNQGRVASSLFITLMVKSPVRTVMVTIHVHQRIRNEPLILLKI